MRCQDKHNKTALMHAAITGNDDMTKLLLQEMNMVDENGMTALMHACRNKHTECASLLLGEAGKVDSNQNTALMYASQQGLSEIVEALAPREFYSGDYFGKSALDYAREARQEACIGILLQIEEEIEQ